MKQNLFFRLALSFLLANLTSSKPIIESKEILEIRSIIEAFVDQLAHADILKPKEEPKVQLQPKQEEPNKNLQNRNHPIIDSFKIVSIYLKNGQLFH